MHKIFKQNRYQIFGLALFVITTIFIIMTKLTTKQPAPQQNTQDEQITEYSKGNLIQETLYAFSYTPKEIKIYNYFFLYGPATLQEAKAGINFPKDIIDADLISGAHKLERDGFLLKDSNLNYSTTGIDFLIKKNFHQCQVFRTKQKACELAKKSSRIKIAI